MLTEHQAVRAVELDIERIVAGAACVVGIGIAVAIGKVGVAGARVFRIDLRDGAGPDGIVHTGADDNGNADGDVAAVQLVDLALDAVSAVLHQRDVGCGIAAAVRAVLVDGLHLAVHRSRHIRGAGAGGHGIEFLLLDGDVVLRFLLVGLKCLDLHGVGELLRGGRALLFLLELGDLGRQILDVVLHLLNLKFGLVDGELHILHIIGKQDLAGLDLLADPDIELLDLPAGIAVNLDLLLRHDDAGAGVRAAERAIARERRHRLHINRRFPGAAGRQQPDRKHQRKQAAKHSFLHRRSSVSAPQRRFLSASRKSPSGFSPDCFLYIDGAGAPFVPLYRKIIPWKRCLSARGWPAGQARAPSCRAIRHGPHRRPPPRRGR